MATLKLERLNLIYGGQGSGGTHAVRDVDLTIGDGEFCVFLGPSGCGKTSTLRMIAGLETPTSGVVRLDGRVINDLYPGERDIAMVFQSYALYPHLTVRGHLELPLKAQRVPKVERERRVNEIADLLQIADLLEARPRQLSGGQAQRTAIGRALIRQPRLFLLDEPLTNLDARLRLETRAALKRLQSELGLTPIYVTLEQAGELLVVARGVAEEDPQGDAVEHLLPVGELERAGAQSEDLLRDGREEVPGERVHRLPGREHRLVEAAAVAPPSPAREGERVGLEVRHALALGPGVRGVDVRRLVEHLADRLGPPHHDEPTAEQARALPAVVAPDRPQDLDRAPVGVHLRELARDLRTWREEPAHELGQEPRRHELGALGERSLRQALARRGRDLGCDRGLRHARPA